MAKLLKLTPQAIKATIICLLFLGANFMHGNSTRILEEIDQQPQPIVSINTPQMSNPPLPTVTAGTTVPSTTLPASGLIPVATTPATDDAAAAETDATPPLPAAAAVPPPAVVVPPEAVAPPVMGAASTAALPLPAATASPSNTFPAQPAGAGTPPPLSFFMHDILGGSHPSARVVAGLIGFSKINNKLFLITGGITLVNPQTQISGLINSNNLPYLVGLTGAQTSTVIQTTGNNNAVNGGNNQPFVGAGQLPSGLTVQKLMFGSVTIVDDELTEGHELGSAVIGRAQGFYMASSVDGTSQTLVLTVFFHSG